MSTTAAASSWKSSSHSHSHSHSHSTSRSSRPSTTPRGHSAAVSVGQTMPPMLSPHTRTPNPVKKIPQRSPSPSYFGFVAGDDSIPPGSNPGQHARQNWISPSPHPKNPAGESSRQTSVDENPEFAAFRRQSEQLRFKLSQSVSGLHRPSQSRKNSAATPDIMQVESPISPHTKSGFFDGSEHERDASHEKTIEQESFFDIPRNASPGAISPVPLVRGVADHQLPRLSLPGGSLQTPPLNKTRQPLRSDTLPSLGEKGSPTMISPKQFEELIRAMPHEVLLLDLRVYPQYAASRMQGALNLCIPTTLLKRPSFTVQKLAETFASEEDRERFAEWRTSRYIVVYDSNSNLAKEAMVPFNVLKKFTSEGFQGNGLVIKGGFLACTKYAPSLLDRSAVGAKKDPSKSTMSISPPSQDALPVAGGCSMPSTKSAANPFFGNIRQNMDLLDGVGQIAVKHPAEMSQQSENALPLWLKDASDSSNEGRAVSERFLAIEKQEQRRMQEALSCHVSYGSPFSEAPRKIQVAGIEKGSKNRYNNIFPFDHTRVRLQGIPAGGCDYVNASHVQASFSNRRYIASQAPVPSTFNDFWRMLWEQDARVIVMLTAETEGGQVKSHPYWNTGEYGPLKLKKLSEKQLSLEHKDYVSRPADPRRPSLGQRRSTNPGTKGEKKAATEIKPSTPEPPSVIVRHFTLSHLAHPFQPMREITQLQYTQWPDFGAPAEPTALIELIEQMNRYVRGSSSPASAGSADEPVPEGQRPIVVHCSAGCGRTGSFCTIDSVIDMLKRQRWERTHADKDDMDVDTEDNWVNRDDIDLVTKTVDDFRHQRLSMVQNLRQFVMCYESVLHWVVGQQPDSMKLPKDRRSYHGS